MITIKFDVYNCRFHKNQVIILSISPKRVKSLFILDINTKK